MLPPDLLDTADRQVIHHNIYERIGSMVKHGADIPTASVSYTDANNIEAKKKD